MPAADWKLKGSVLIACNCDYGCPCNFNALPTQGYCEGGWTWHVDTGSYGDLSFDGLTFSLYCKWPGAIHHGGGKALAFVDERADESAARRSRRWSRVRPAAVPGRSSAGRTS